VPDPPGCPEWSVRDDPHHEDDAEPRCPPRREHRAQSPHATCKVLLVCSEPEAVTSADSPTSTQETVQDQSHWSEAHTLRSNVPLMAWDPGALGKPPAEAHHAPACRPSGCARGPSFYRSRCISVAHLASRDRTGAFVHADPPDKSLAPRLLSAVDEPSLTSRCPAHSCRDPPGSTNPTRSCSTRGSYCRTRSRR